MQKITVTIKRFEDVGRFVNIVDRMVGAVDLKYGSYVVDARSVVGVATLVGSKALELCMYQKQNVNVLNQLQHFAFCVA